MPSRVAERSHAGEIDLGMIPSIEYAAGDYAIVPGIAIAQPRAGALGAALPSRPAARRAPRGARHLQPDERGARRRSCCASGWDATPSTCRWPPGRPDGCWRPPTPRCVIGDPALYYAGDVPSGWTWARSGRGGPACRSSTPSGRAGRAPSTPADVARLQEALRSGLARARRPSPRPTMASAPGTRRDNESYLRCEHRLRPGRGRAAGLREFYRRAHASGLIPRVPELRFHADP